MIPLTYNQAQTLKPWFLPDEPGPLIGLHVLQTGHGNFWADRWPNPRVVLAETAGNCSLHGDPDALTPHALRPLIAGFVAAPKKFRPLLQATFSDLIVWDRIVLELRQKPHFALPSTPHVRPIVPDDTDALNKLSLESSWISKTWSSSANLAASGYGWGAFVEGRLVSVACTFFVGEQYEDMGVVTEPEFRGQGLSAACSGALCQDIQQRGRRASWSTSPDNIASLRVAEKLDFIHVRNSLLYVTGIPMPGA